LFIKISILTPDLSHNCLGRAHLLAKILHRKYEVEVVGPLYEDYIWNPIAKLDDFEYKYVRLGYSKVYFELRDLFKKISGDVIYVSKPLFTSYGIGLLKKFAYRLPLILDIDDWQMGFIKTWFNDLSLSQRISSLLNSAIIPYSYDSYWSTQVAEMLIPLSNEVTVSNHFLQKRFGGKIVWHARDTAAFDPNKFDKRFCRRKYGIDNDKKVVMFCGTPSSHKGIESLIDSVCLIQDSDVKLILVGLEDGVYSQNLTRIGEQELGGRFQTFGLQGFDRIPEFLAFADLVVIPQRKSLETIGQMPAKVFDAMAMAKPIIATNVSDLPEVLAGCGWIIEPDNSKQLAQTICRVLDSPEDAEKMGLNARKKCIDRYSHDAMEKVLMETFKKYEK
jgi:glycosyltransferase involved in cell wall biosynthesis